MGYGGGVFVMLPATAQGWQRPVGEAKILTLGDSITRGYITTNHGAYRTQLFYDLHHNSKNSTLVGPYDSDAQTVDGVAFPTGHGGVDGEEIATISARTDAAMVAFTPAIVIVHAGTNDMINNTSVGTAPDRLDTLIGVIVARDPTCLIIVCQIIPSTSGAVDGRIVTFNAAIPALVTARQASHQFVRRVDLYTPVNANLGTYLADAYHPSDAGCVVMADVLYTDLLSAGI